MADSLDRRPVAARSHGAIQFLATALAKSGVSPNVISALGAVVAIGGGVAWASAYDGPAWLWLLGAVAVLLRCAANVFDGMVAGLQRRCSPLGEVWNDAPDRLSDIAFFTGAGIGIGIPWLGLCASMMALCVAYVRVLGKSVGAPSIWVGPMAKPLRMGIVGLAAVVEFTLLTMGQDAPGARPMAIALGLIVVLGMVTLVRRLRRIAQALSANQARAVGEHRMSAKAEP